MEERESTVSFVNLASNTSVQSNEQNGSNQNSAATNVNKVFDSSDPSSRVKDTYGGMNVAGDGYARANGKGLEDSQGIPTFIIGAVVVMALAFYLLLFY